LEALEEAAQGRPVQAALTVESVGRLHLGRGQLVLLLLGENLVQHRGALAAAEACQASRLEAVLAGRQRALLLAGVARRLRSAGRGVAGLTGSVPAAEVQAQEEKRIKQLLRADSAEAEAAENRSAHLALAAKLLDQAAQRPAKTVQCARST